MIWNVVNSPVLRSGTLALVDTNPQVLDTMVRLARRAANAVDAPVTVEGATDRGEVLASADFVVLTFSDRNAHFRGVDCEISNRHGIRMCSGDTIGPGGVFRALREIPVALDVAADVERLAPRAWMLNFVNPATVLGIALDRYAPAVRSFAICDGPHEPHNWVRMLKRLGIVPENAVEMPVAVEQKLEMEIVGVNHFSWVTTLRYDGVDYLPRWREVLAADAERERATTASQEGGTDNNAASKARYNATYALELMDVFGAYPDRVAHTRRSIRATGWRRSNRNPNRVRRLHPPRPDGRTLGRERAVRLRRAPDERVSARRQARPRHRHYRVDVGRPGQAVLSQHAQRRRRAQHGR